ncbi:MAG: DUF2306 domain-containing protein [Chloroflexi bacterium CFX2]|nr:DUF2306 domain-containing protein [Chloroflexi bacterium CFX2]
MKTKKGLNQIGWWLLFFISAFYGLYALYMGVVEILHQLGIVDDAKIRAAPWIFIVHALTGGIGLISGALQFNRSILNKHKATHRLIGKIYLYAIWITSVAALWSAFVFDVNLPAKFAFGILAILWFGATTIAYLRIRKRRIREHREWVIRSFSLSLFFVTFSFWVPGLTESSIPYEVAYPLAVFLSWTVNLLVAELWIRKSRNSFVQKDLTRLEAEIAGD